MTAKKKAEELVKKMPVEYAIILVDEILKELPCEILDTWKSEVCFVINERYQYFENVKKEIKKL